MSLELQILLKCFGEISFTNSQLTAKPRLLLAFLLLESRVPLQTFRVSQGDGIYDSKGLAELFFKGSTDALTRSLGFIRKELPDFKVVRTKEKTKLPTELFSSTRTELDLFLKPIRDLDAAITIAKQGSFLAESDLYSELHADLRNWIDDIRSLVYQTLWNAVIELLPGTTEYTNVHFEYLTDVFVISQLSSGIDEIDQSLLSFLEDSNELLFLKYQSLLDEDQSIQSLKRVEFGLPDGLKNTISEVVSQQINSHFDTAIVMPSSPRRQVLGFSLRLNFFEGRKKALKKIKKALYIQKLPLVQICGPVGMGKSALATKIINEDEAFNVIVFYSFIMNTSASLEEILRLLRQALNTDKQDLFDQVLARPVRLDEVLNALLVEVFAQQRILIVLDNVEVLLDEGEFKSAYKDIALFISKVCALTHHACQLLLTSREAINLSILDRDLGGLNSSLFFQLNAGLKQHESLALFKHYAELNNDLAVASHKDLLLLADELEGVPMSLNAAAIALKSKPSLTVNSLLTDKLALERLKLEPVEALVAALSVEEQTTLKVLAVFAEPVPLEALEFVAEEVNIASSLSQLVSKFAIQMTAKGMLYTQRPSQQNYLYELIPDEMKISWHLAAAKYFALNAKPLEASVDIDDLACWVSEVKHLCKANAMSAAFELLNSFDEKLLLYGAFKQMLQLHLMFEGELETKADKAKNLFRIGVAYEALSDFPLAIDAFNRALALINEAELINLKFDILLVLARSQQKTGSIDLSNESLKDVLIHSKTIGNKQLEAKVLSNLGVNNFMTGQSESGIAKFKESIRLSQEINDKQNEAKYLGNLANAYKRLGKWNEAKDLLLKGLDISQGLNDVHTEALHLGNLGSVFLYLGEYEEAIKYFEMNLLCSKKLGDSMGESVALGNLGLVYLELGLKNGFQKDIDKCFSFFNAALSLSRKLGDKEGEGRHNSNIGRAYLKMKKYREASFYLDEAKRLFTVTQSRNLLVVEDLLSKVERF